MRDYYLETIQTVFQDFKLVHGTWDVRSPEGKIERVRPQDISHGALLTIEGELDDISGRGQTQAAHDLCTGIPARSSATTWKSRVLVTTASSAAAAGAKRSIRKCAPSFWNTRRPRIGRRLWRLRLRHPRPPFAHRPALPRSQQHRKLRHARW